MKRVVRQIFDSHKFKVFLWMVLEKGASIGMGFARYKALALVTGAAGLGLFGILQSIQSVMSTLSTVSLSETATGYIAKKRSSGIAVRTRSALTISLGFSLGVCGAVLTFSIANFLPISSEASLTFAQLSLLALGVFVAPVAAAQMAILVALGKLKQVVSVGFFGTTLSTALVILLLSMLGDRSIVWAVVSTPLMGVVLGSAVLGSVMLPNFSLLFRNWRQASSLLKLGSLSMLASVCNPLGQFILRAFLAKYQTLEDVGFFVGAFVLGQYLSLVFVAALRIDFFPKYAASVSVDEKSYILNDRVKFTMVMLGISALPVALSIPFILTLVFDDSFIEAKNLAYCFAYSEMIRLFSQVFVYIFLVQRQGIRLLISSLVYNLTFVGLSIILMSAENLMMIGVAAIAANVVYLFTLMAFFHCSSSTKGQKIEPYTAIVAICVLLFSAAVFLLLA